MGRVEGKVALVTGAARGQGRSHAVRLAQEGADIIAVDICEELKTVPYDGATDGDLAETVSMVEDLDRHVLSRKADVRSLAAMESCVADAITEFGRLDIVVANAGIGTFGPSWELTEETWQEMIDINLTGVWKSVRPAIPHMISQGSGSIILTSSTAGLVAYGNLSHYTAAKHGVVGLMRSLAVELAPHNVRVNSVHPTTVDTPMIQNEPIRQLFLGVEGASREDAQVAMKGLNALPIPWVEAIDISNAVLYLASDEARYVTGHTQVIDAGGTAPYRFPHA